MSNLLGTWDPRRLSFVVGGFPITGFADGTFCVVEEASEGFTYKSGADGEVARAVSTTLVVDITLTLLQSSASNDILNNLYNRDRLTVGGAVFPIVIESLSGTSMYMSGQTWIKKRSRVTFAAGLENREWMLVSVSPNVVNFVAGSN